jgi:DNA-binding CsgD family transcriptional regulator
VAGQAVRDGIIGRERELGELGRFLSGTDGPSILLLHGEAGAGKTTLWLAGMELAVAEERLVLRSRPAEAEATLALAGIGDLLEGVLTDVLPALPEPQRHALAAALLLEPGEAPGERAVSAAFLTALRTLAEHGPVLVAVDDLQWLDPASAGVLLYALRRLRGEPIRALLAQRDEPGTSPAAGLRARVSPSELDELVVGPLSLGAIHSLLRARLDYSPSRPVLRRIHEAAGGNPFFALELGRALRHRGGRLDPGEALPVPDDLTRLVVERLAELPPDTKEALAAAATLARPTVASVAAEPAALEPAVAAQVIQVEDDRIRFTHPLLASALSAGAGETERRALHRLLAERVESSEEQARHLALAAAGPDEDVAAMLDGAAEEALARGASEAAADLWEQAARLTPPAREDDVARRTTAAARFRFVSGDTAAALELLERAIPAMPPGRLRGAALVTLGRVHQYEGNQPLAVELFEQGLNETDDDLVRADASTDLAFTLFWLRERLDEACAHAARGVELAERVGDAGRYANAVGVRQVVDGISGRKEAATMSEEVARLGEPGYLGYFLLWTDDADEAARNLGRQQREEQARGEESGLPLTLVALGVAEYLRGRWTRATEAAQEALELALQTGERHNEAFALAVRALVQGSRGDVEGCRADAAEALGIAGERAIAVARIHAVWALGVLELSLGNAEAVARLLGPHRERLLAAGVGEPGSIRFVPDEIEALVALGRTDEAEAPLAWLEERGRTLDRASALAAAARCRGLLALARRDTEAALASLEEALREHDRVDLPFERARTRLAQGIALRHARRRRDARAAIDEARGAFAALGAALWEAQAAAELDRIGGRRSAGDELTPAEERVAALVAEGHTNKEVAAALFLTKRTVEFHLTHVYRKLGVRSRAELARRLLG